MEAAVVVWVILSSERDLLLVDKDRLADGHDVEKLGGDVFGLGVVTLGAVVVPELVTWWAKKTAEFRHD